MGSGVFGPLPMPRFHVLLSRHSAATGPAQSLGECRLQNGPVCHSMRLSGGASSYRLQSPLVFQKGMLPKVKWCLCTVSLNA
jgi:hypothetical protein